MARKDIVWLRHACGNHQRGIHCTWSPTPGTSECFEANDRHHGRCSFETSTHESPFNFDSDHVFFEPYAAMPSPHINPIPTLSAPPMLATTPEPMSFHCAGSWYLVTATCTMCLCKGFRHQFFGFYA